MWQQPRFVKPVKSTDDSNPADLFTVDIADVEMSSDAVLSCAGTLPPITDDDSMSIDYRNDDDKFADLPAGPPPPKPRMKSFVITSSEDDCDAALPAQVSQKKFKPKVPFFFRRIFITQHLKYRVISMRKTTMLHCLLKYHQRNPNLRYLFFLMYIHHLTLEIQSRRVEAFESEVNSDISSQS